MTLPTELAIQRTEEAVALTVQLTKRKLDVHEIDTLCREMNQKPCDGCGAKKDADCKRRERGHFCFDRIESNYALLDFYGVL